MIASERLQLFRVVAETLHFRRAAERLRLSQSAVSQQIAALERELGVALFERIGRLVFLTPAGEALAQEAPRALASLARAEEAVRQIGRVDGGVLRVGASTTPGIYLLPEILKRFHAAFPRVTLRFRIANSAAIQSALRANELDVGVVGEPADGDELFARRLGPDRVLSVAAPSLVGRTRRLAPADLRVWPLLDREPGSATRKAVEQALATVGVRLTPAFELPSPEALLRAASAGLGVAFLSAFAVESEIAAGRLVRLEVTGVEVVREIFAAHHRDKRVTQPMAELMGLVEGKLRARRGSR
jgi:DNA-binding transcriptional LysR family regulator